MNVFDIKVVREARCTRVLLQGQLTLGKVLSLLQVLEVDCPHWPPDAVLLDLRELQLRLEPAQHARIAADAARALRRVKRIALLVRPGTGGVRECTGVRVFQTEDEALRWFAD